MIHYYAVTLIESETEYSMLQSELKLCTALLNITPYARMLPGLSITLAEAIASQLGKEKTLFAKWAQRTPILTNQALRACQ